METPIENERTFTSLRQLVLIIEETGKKDKVIWKANFLFWRVFLKIY